MRIAVCANHVRGNGSTIVGQNILEQMLRLDPTLEVELWAPQQWSSEFFARLPAERTTLHRVAPGTLSKFATENARIRAALRKRRPDAIFSLGDTSLVAAPAPHLLLVQNAYLARRLRDLPPRLPAAFRAKIALMHAYFRLGRAGVTRFTVQTEHMKRDLCRTWALAPDIVDVVPSALGDLPTADPSAREPELSGRYLAYVANDAHHKNQLLLPDVLAALSPRHRDVRCALTIGPSDLPELTERARTLGVLDRFVFLGRVDRARAIRLLAGASAVVIPSLLESFGLTYFEAMALGRPVVAADLDFAREPCGEAALYADPGDPNAFARAVETLLDTPALATRLGELGRARVAAHSTLDWRHIAGRYLELLRTLTGATLDTASLTSI